MTQHHGCFKDSLPGLREPGGDYPFFLAQLFPQHEWYNFGKGGSSNFEYIRRISNFIETVGRPDFVLVQLTYAERMLLEFHNYQKIDLKIEPLIRDNYFQISELNLREHAAYISGYNLYCSALPQKTLEELRKVTTLHLSSTFHAWRFWETHFLIQNYLEKMNLPHLLFITHSPVNMVEPPLSHLPLDFSTTLEQGRITLHDWIEKEFGPYENLTIGNGDYHLQAKYNEAVARRFLMPKLKVIIDG